MTGRAEKENGAKRRMQRGSRCSFLPGQLTRRERRGGKEDQEEGRKWRQRSAPVEATGRRKAGEEGPLPGRAQLLL